MTTKRLIVSIVIGWIIFIGVDFLFHASILAHMWVEDIESIHSLEKLALMIPVGYLSFLLLTTLIGYIFFIIFKVKPQLKAVLNFAMVFGVLYSLSNFTGIISYINIPIKHAIAFNLVYFVEIFVVTISIYLTAFTTNLKKTVWLSVLTFLILIVVGITIQNIF